MEAPAIVIIDPKYPHNVGAAICACACFSVKSLIWISLQTKGCRSSWSWINTRPLLQAGVDAARVTA